MAKLLSLNEVPGWLKSTASPAGDPHARLKEECRLMDLDWDANGRRDKTPVTGRRRGNRSENFLPVI